ncbi:penicillin-binding protein activator [Celeribacter persicus]|jgi:ABC-type branched-chain amino acid transport systems, periplasmic component|uniref:Amino acid/amide ABC transporter substrate-binding protein (HAAT family) n=1 Tax=Celeribacter persicus TaxID=1651082 RepID=A0A2T5HGQ3_9RHOB|nr:penicillin-binding protein activator [Celeribacter persicus]PTQ70758.1 amino acid/amide ABC transporter substrate-binding protein (HAAT family) [Celeribacter persicus]
MFAVLRAARKSLAKFALGLSLLGLAACDPGALPVGGGPTINTSKPVPVALLVPYESASAGDVALATSLENAARLAMADLGGVTIDLRVYPTGGQAERASAAASQAVADGAKIILGPVYGGSAKLAGIPAANAGINVLSFSNNPDIAGGNVFILGPTFENTANRLMSYARANGKGRIMVVNGNSAAENAGAAAIKAAISRQGATLVGEQSFEMSQQGVVQAIQPIASKARSTGADAIFFTSGNDGAMPLLAQMLPENGIKSPNPQYIGLQRWNVPASALTLPGLQDSWFAIPDQQLTANFSGHYSATYGQPPHALAGLAYDGIAAIGALVKAGDQNALTTQGLTRNSGFVGVNGIFRLRTNGTNERGLSIATIQNNQVIEIDPAPRAFGGAGF